MGKQRKKIGIGEHENDSSIPMIVFNSSLSNMFTSFDVPIAGTKIENYYASIKTNIDITKYKPISIEYTGVWCEKCFFTLYDGGQSISIGCIQENYTISTSISDLKVICVINK